MVNYIFLKSQDKYYVTNNEVTALKYTVKRLQDCTNFYSVFSDFILPSEKVEINLSTDGEYQVVLENDALDTVTINIKDYRDLLSSIADDALEYFCNCPCVTCDDCGSEDEDNSKCFMAKLLAYKGLVNPKGSYINDTIYNEVKCIIEKEIQCSLSEQLIIGFKDCSKLLKKLIAIEFLTIYFSEYLSYCLSGDTQYIRDKFNFDKISTCLQEMGIDTEKLEDLLKDNSTIVINTDAYINLPATCVGDLSIAAQPYEIITLTLDNFTTLTIPPYSDPENDTIDAVRIDTLPLDGTLTLNNVPVTQGQIITVEDINLNILKYKAPSLPVNTTSLFVFSLRDSGSGQFATGC